MNAHEPVVPAPGDGGLVGVRGRTDTVRVRLDLGYDGTEFAGWATQPGQRTVQETVEAALAVVLRLPEPPRLTVAGRTDSGVHARGQVAHVDVPAAAWEAAPGRSRVSPEEGVVRRLAGVLPRDVRVHRARLAPEGFDARFSPVWRRYAYRLCDAPGGPDPLRRHEVVAYGRPLDVAAMDEAARALVGEHDFAAYCRRREGASTVRCLQVFGWRRPAVGEPDEGLVVATVVADAFCHNMVRSLVGASLAVGEGRRPHGWPGEVLARAVRDPAVHVAPPHGLTLEEVGFPADEELAARAEATRRHRGRQPDGVATDGAVR